MRKHWFLKIEVAVHAETEQEAIDFGATIAEKLGNEYDEAAGLAGIGRPIMARLAPKNVTCVICECEEAKG